MKLFNFLSPKMFFWDTLNAVLTTLSKTFGSKTVQMKFYTFQLSEKTLKLFLYWNQFSEYQFLSNFALTVLRADVFAA